MPRYAVNLGATPLQPQSTATTFASHSENLNNDKQISMSDTWTDSNNTNGQECEYFFIINHYNNVKIILRKL